MGAQHACRERQYLQFWHCQLVSACCDMVWHNTPHHAAQMVLAGAAAFPGAVGVSLPSLAEPVLTVKASLVGADGQPATNSSLAVQVGPPPA